MQPTLKELDEALAYKLQSSIKPSTDFKKILKKRILNGQVEFPLAKVLEIGKREFHEVIINILKRKWQII